MFLKYELSVNLVTLVVFSATFVADTKIIFRYDFVTPLKVLKARKRSWN